MPIQWVALSSSNPSKVEMGILDGDDKFDGDVLMLCKASLCGDRSCKLPSTLAKRLAPLAVGDIAERLFSSYTGVPEPPRGPRAESERLFDLLAEDMAAPVGSAGTVRMNWDDLVTFAQEFSEIAGGKCTSQITREDFMYADETGIALITSANYTVHLPTFLSKTLWPYAQESIRGPF